MSLSKGGKVLLWAFKKAKMFHLRLFIRRQGSAVGFSKADKVQLWAFKSAQYSALGFSKAD